MTPTTIEIDVRQLYTDQAKLDALPQYEAAAIAAAGEGRDVVLTGQGPIWLYLRLAHALHGRARKLYYRSPLTGDVMVFNHDPR